MLVGAFGGQGAILDTQSRFLRTMEWLGSIRMEFPCALLPCYGACLRSFIPGSDPQESFNVRSVRLAPAPPLSSVPNPLSNRFP
jgi:hypothetical protein